MSYVVVKPCAVRFAVPTRYPEHGQRLQLSRGLKERGIRDHRAQHSIERIDSSGNGRVDSRLLDFQQYRVSDHSNEW